MKTQTELFELIGKATLENFKDVNTWFFHFSGHVNQLDIRFYNVFSHDGRYDYCSVYLTEDGVQEAYWFIKNRLRSK